MMFGRGGRQSYVVGLRGFEENIKDQMSRGSLVIGSE
jgi:hypothetical protein